MCHNYFCRLRSPRRRCCYPVQGRIFRAEVVGATAMVEMLTDFSIGAIVLGKAVKVTLLHSDNMPVSLQNSTSKRWKWRRNFQVYHHVEVPFHTQMIETHGHHLTKLARERGQISFQNITLVCCWPWYFVWKIFLISTLFRTKQPLAVVNRRKSLFSACGV